MDSNQLSTTSKGITLPKGRDALKHCPVAMRLYDHAVATAGFPMEAVAVLAATDTGIRSASESVRSKSVTVKSFSKDYGEYTLSAVVLAHLTMVEDMLNVSRPLKPDTMAALAKKMARMLLDDDMDWNLADIRIVADRLADGDAGQVFGGLTTPLVRKAFLEYMCEKMDAFTEMRNEEAWRYNEIWDQGIDTRRSSVDPRAEIRKHREAAHDYQLRKYKEGKP